MKRLVGLLTLCASMQAMSLPATPATPATPAWIVASNAQAELLTQIVARYDPEDAAAMGIEGHDADVIDLKPRYAQRQEADLTAAGNQLQSYRRAASDPQVQQDLDILVGYADDRRQSLELHRRLMVPYLDLSRIVYSGFSQLIHDGVAKDRQAMALTRLRRYAGLEAGFAPIAVLARARLAESLANTELVAPWGDELRQSIANQPHYLDGMRQLFETSGLQGWQAPLRTLTTQLNDYGAWIQATLLPKARPSYRLPEQLYTDDLKSYGVYADPRDLMQQALSAYSGIREQMTALAATIAATRGYPSAAYPDVIRELKKDKIPNAALLGRYRERVSALDAIIRAHRLLTLPAREPRIRLGSAAESAASPVPYVEFPRLIGNTGQSAVLIVPVFDAALPTKDRPDDFSFDAVTWTLTAKDVVPGHELQFSRMVEAGVSTARAVFAANDVNTEGWGIYAEAVVAPYFPLEGQLASLQLRLLRTARAFLDPMVNLGLIEPDVALRVLLKDVCLSEAAARHEVQRYTFTSPGQAPAYFYGYQILQATRAKTELALGDRFDQASYHDFILSQGLVPLLSIDRAVMQEYVPAHRQ